jgi:hypothetical protein
MAFVWGKIDFSGAGTFRDAKLLGDGAIGRDGDANALLGIRAWVCMCAGAEPRPPL